MAKSKQSRKLRILTLALSIAMILSFCAFGFAACADNDTSDDETTEESTTKKTDTQTFKNGNFEFFDDSDETYLIGTAENWTGSADSNDGGVTASTSLAKSGIVDTSMDWAEFSKAFDQYTYYEGLEDDDPKLEDAEYYKDIDKNYDIPGWDIANAAHEPDEDAEEDDGPDSATVEAAAKALNPGTHNVEAEEADEENGTHVLMIHNYRDDGYGAAYTYTSSSMTLSAGTAAQISLWVKTSDLTFNGNTTASSNRGAFIKVAPTVGGTTQDPMIVRNINTEGVEENNGWVQYTFYVRASDYATTTFTMTLGLGRQVESSSENKYGYVSGYAFFDDLTYDIMTAGDYETKTADVVSSQNITLDLSSASDEAKFNASNVDSNSFAYNLNDVTRTSLTLSGVVAADTEDEYGNTIADITGGSNLQVASDLTKSGLVAAKDITADNGYTSKLVKDFEKYSSLPFASDDLILLYSTKGAPYTATTDTEFTLKSDEYMLISFWAKTSSLNGGTGASVSLVNPDNESSIAAFDTSILAGTDIKDDNDSNANKDEWEDIYDGWQRCFFFVSNTTDSDITFTIEFHFGTTAIAGTSLSSYVPGYAAFAGFETAMMSEDSFNLKSTGDRAVSVALSDGSSEPTAAFDSVAEQDSKKIETDIASPENYIGVNANSSYVGGNDSTEENEAVNANPTTGLVNYQYASNYIGTAWQSIVGGTNANYWNDVFGVNSIQPLVIATQTRQAYGYIANSTSTLSSNSYTAITYRVKLSAGATASIYLTDTTETDFDDPMYTNSIVYSSGVSYRYDKNGNVVDLDPEDPAFNTKTNTLFYYNKNTGLWTKERSFTSEEFYANLKNYETDKDGNLIDKDDNIVYYKGTEDGVYYRYKDEDTEELSVKVKDFTAAYTEEQLSKAVLQSGVEDKALQRTITNDSDTTSDWIYVRFFIATGNKSRNYRLEFWAGTRDGSIENPANSFAAFELVNYGTFDSSRYESLLDTDLDEYAKIALGSSTATAKDLLNDYEADPYKYIDGDETQLVYFWYSMYDNADYAPYNSDYNTGDNPYTSYDASSYSNTVAYFDYKHEYRGNEYFDTFVNYSTSEVSVPDISSSSDDSSTDSDDDDEDSNVWLLVTSIVLAVVLIFTLLILLIRKLLANIKRRDVRGARPSYDSKRKRYIRKLRLEEAEKDEKADDVLPTEGEISEEDIYKVEADDEAESEDVKDTEATEESSDDKKDE